MSLNAAQKGKYLRLLFEYGELQVVGASDLDAYFTKCNFKKEYCHSLCGGEGNPNQPVYRFLSETIAAAQEGE